MHIEGLSDRHMLIFEKDDKIMKSLTSWAAQNELKGGMVTGIGALKNVELGYYNLEEKTYQRKTFSESDYELISFTGNISLKGGEYFSHIHVLLADASYQAFGGHLFEAEVAVTAEIFVTPLGVLPQRNFDKCIGLDLIDDTLERQKR